MAAARVVALWGCDYPNLGDVEVRALDTNAAVGITPGRVPKARPALDPNEDAVLAAAGRHGRLLAVADGHHGFDAARAALDAIVQYSDVAVTASLPDPAHTLNQLLVAAARAVQAALRQASHERHDSRTALSLALIADDRLYAATLGDTVVLRVRGPRALSLCRPTPFLGPSAGEPATGEVSLREGDTVVVASDGLTDFLGTRWKHRVGQIVAGRTAVDGVRELLRAAMAGGAGDHVSAGVNTF